MNGRLIESRAIDHRLCQYFQIAGSCGESRFCWLSFLLRNKERQIDDGMLNIPNEITDREQALRVLEVARERDCQEYDLINEIFERNHPGIIASLPPHTKL